MREPASLPPLTSTGLASSRTGSLFMPSTMSNAAAGQPGLGLLGTPPVHPPSVTHDLFLGASGVTTTTASTMSSLTPDEGLITWHGFEEGSVQPTSACNAAVSVSDDGGGADEGRARQGKERGGLFSKLKKSLIKAKEQTPGLNTPSSKTQTPHDAVQRQGCVRAQEPAGNGCASTAAAVFYHQPEHHQWKPEQKHSQHHQDSVPSSGSMPSPARSMSSDLLPGQTGNFSGRMDTLLPRSHGSSPQFPALQSTGAHGSSPGDMLLSLSSGCGFSGPLPTGPASSSVPPPHARTRSSPALELGGASGTLGPVSDAGRGNVRPAQELKPEAQTLIGIAPGASPAALEAYLKAKAAQQRRSAKHLIRVVEVSKE